MTTVGDVAAAMEELFPASTAEGWDKVGLVVGDEADEVRLVGFAVDPCEATIREAIDRGAQLLITHHPMYLRGTSAITSQTGKGRWTLDLIRNRVALLAAHTNADVAVSTRALADLLGMSIEHPLEETTGIGGVGTLAEALTLREFTRKVADVLPPVPAGVVAGGDPDARVSRVAICSGAGDSLLEAAQASGADVYLTADLRHHPATDHLWNGGCALVSATHWASEWPLLGYVRDALVERLGGIDTYVSTIPTDPWILAERN